VKCNVRYDAKRRFDVPYNVLDIGKIASETGWRPHSTLLDGLRIMKTSLESHS
jgi:nucleoside-diphosphate-sugar epimerase